MHAIIKKNIIQKLRMLIEEGHIYLITNLKVIHTNRMYRLIKNDKKILFLLTTKLTKILEDDICPPLYKFYFVNYDEMVNLIDNHIYFSGKNKSYTCILFNLLIILLN